MDYYEIENGRKYVTNYYYFKNDGEIYLCKHWQNENNEDDYDLETASTNKDYELDDLMLDEDTIITKKEFENLYKKFKHLFKIDVFK